LSTSFQAAFGTAKAIGNAMKAKGLQKLRWYCEPCQKQCRDEVGTSRITDRSLVKASFKNPVAFFGFSPSLSNNNDSLTAMSQLLAQ
jgi:DNA/RNA-binding protein KIN17